MSRAEDLSFFVVFVSSSRPWLYQKHQRLGLSLRSAVVAELLRMIACEHVEVLSRSRSPNRRLRRRSSTSMVSVILSALAVCLRARDI